MYKIANWKQDITPFVSERQKCDILLFM